MFQKTFTILAALAVAIPLVAEAPKGWKMRVDRSTEASDPDAPGDIKFEVMGKGFHATNPKAAVYWNPAVTASGAYAVKGTFILQKPSGHNNYYGLAFAGSKLEGAEQSYLYFLIGQNGSYIVKRREGDATSNIVGRTPHEAVKKPGDDGKSSNDLEVRVGSAKVDFLINGVTVHSAPKEGPLAATDGIAGIRINHQLEVHIDNFAVTR
jgi:hypothetical protein